MFLFNASAPLKIILFPYLFKFQWPLVFMFCFYFKQEDGISSMLRVWVADVETGKARPLFESSDVFLNAVFDKYV